MSVTIHPSQIRGARAMLAWSMVDLSKAAHVSVATIKRLEQQSPDVAPDKFSGVVQDVFEFNGVRFLPDDGNGPGVRLRVAKV